VSTLKQESRFQPDFGTARWKMHFRSPPAGADN
jgi:hypothetical protein